MTSDIKISKSASWRYATKAFDARRKIADADMSQLLDVMQLAPSSVNLQPWHMVVASTDAGKARIAQCTEQDAGYRYNTPKILDASHVVVFAARQDMQPDYVRQTIEAEDAAGRYKDEATMTARRDFVLANAAKKQDAGDVPDWASNQVYLNVGSLLLAAATLQIDAVPMEGFDKSILDEVLGFKEKNMKAVLIVSLGYRAEDDFNAKLPKGRLARDEIFTFI